MSNIAQRKTRPFCANESYESVDVFLPGSLFFSLGGLHAVDVCAMIVAIAA